MNSKTQIAVSTAIHETETPYKNTQYFLDAVVRKSIATLQFQPILIAFQVRDVGLLSAVLRGPTALSNGRFKKTPSSRIGEPDQNTSSSFTLSEDYKRVWGSNRPSEEALLQLLL